MLRPARSDKLIHDNVRKLKMYTDFVNKPRVHTVDVYEDT